MISRFTNFLATEAHLVEVQWLEEQLNIEKLCISLRAGTPTVY
jgi:hypothetical protein